MDIYKNYKDYLKDKIVVIVGGGENINEELVESADIVVRINQHWLTQGGRIDVLYHTMFGRGLEPENLMKLFKEDFRPKFMFLNKLDRYWELGLSQYKIDDLFYNFQKEHSNETQIEYFAQGQWLYQNPYGDRYEWLNEIHKKFNCKLLTGLVALADVLRFKPREVYTQGMNLYYGKPKRLKEYRDSHFIPGQIAFLKDTLKNNPPDNKPSLYLNDDLIESMQLYEDELGPVEEILWKEVFRGE